MVLTLRTSLSGTFLQREGCRKPVLGVCMILSVEAWVSQIGSTVLDHSEWLTAKTFPRTQFMLPDTSLPASTHRLCAPVCLHSTQIPMSTWHSTNTPVPMWHSTHTPMSMWHSTHIPVSMWHSKHTQMSMRYYTNTPNVCVVFHAYPNVNVTFHKYPKACDIPRIRQCLRDILHIP